MGLSVIRQSNLAGILGGVVEVLRGKHYLSPLCQPSMTGASNMLMQGATLPYTPNFSIRTLLDFNGLAASVMLSMMRIISGEIKITLKGGRRVD